VPREAKKGKRRQEIADWGEAREKEAEFLEKVTADWTIAGILQELGVTLELRFARLLEMLRLVQGKFLVLDDLSQAILDSEKFEAWKGEDFLLARAENRLPTLDEIIDWRGLSRIEIAGSLAAAGFILGMNHAKAILGRELPRVMQSAIELATEGDGQVAHLSQKLLFEAGGLTKNGPSTVVSINNTNTTNVAVGLPKWDDVDKVVTKAYFGKEPGVERLRLPATEPASDNVIEGELVQEKEYAET